MKTSIRFKQIVAILGCWLFSSCEDYLEIEAPNDRIVSETVFSNDDTAISAMAGIYNQLIAVFFSGGGPDSVTVLAGLSADDLTTIRTNNRTYMEFEQHEILPNNSRNLNLWSSAYNMIYMTNSLLEGLANSQSLTEEVKVRLEGEAKFVRAFTYFYLVNLYGEVPLILTTDYRQNALAARSGEEEVYQQLLIDLNESINLLGTVYTDGERIQITRNTATALLARVQLYLKNWQEAELLSSEIINQSGTFELLNDLDLVFLKNSKEAIWQLSPKGRGNSMTQTNESIFIIHPTLPVLSHLKLDENFINSYDEVDKRYQQWINFHSRTNSHYAFKYKIKNSTEEITEYSMVMRLAEQFLIRAEARAMQGDLEGAIADLDMIRDRAGLPLFADINPGISKEELLTSILEERKKELFTEWGHRWLDLKRTQRIEEVFGAADPFWQPTDVLYPIPEEERIKNPNLTKNDGY